MSDLRSQWTFCDFSQHEALFRGERGRSVVECRTPEREVRGSKPTAAVLCPWARHFTPRKYWLITQEAMAPSRHDWKIVDWDVKPQHNQPTNFFVRLNSAVFKVFICENRKLPILCLKHPLFHHLHKHQKWTAVRHHQMVNVAKHVLSSEVFSPLFTKAWKLLPGYFLFLLSICIVLYVPAIILFVMVWLQIKF